MRNILFATMLVIGSVGANASIAEFNGPLDSKLFEAEVFQGKSYFDTLGDMFSQGTQPDPKKLTGVLWAGRCFFASKPDAPTNTAYIFRSVKSDVGPIGNMNNSYEARGFYYPSKAPNYYDTLTLQEAMKDMSIGFNKITITQTSLVYKTSSSIEEMKQSGKYLVLEVKEKSDAGPLASGKTHVRCYYFIPEMNH